MAKGYTTRKLEVWALHAHVEADALVEYEALFQTIATQPVGRRSFVKGDRLVAIPHIERRDGQFWLIAYEGSLGVNPLIFNTEDAQERVERLHSGEIVATKTHALIDLGTREAIIEYNHRGAKAADIAKVLERSIPDDDNWPDLSLDFRPVVEQSFNEAIDSFTRLRVADVRLVKPNLNWNDWEDELTDAARDSNAQTVQAEFTAPRGQSLDQDRGVVAFIKRMVAAPLSPLKSASVTGRRGGEDEETTISTANHIDHQRINVRVTEDGHVDDADIEGKLRRFSDVRHQGHEEDE